MDQFTREEEFAQYRALLTKAPPEEHRQVLLLLIKCLLEAERDEPTEH
jgi:hypothetical protein